MLEGIRIFHRLYKSTCFVLAGLILLCTSILLLKTITPVKRLYAIKLDETISETYPLSISTSKTVNSLNSPSIESEILKILHYVFKGEEVFESYKSYIKSCLDKNPDWQVWFWSDAHSEKLIADQYANFVGKYRGYADRLEKSDSVRYMILHRFGGVYLDMDVECRKPFSQLWNHSPVQESLIATPVSHRTTTITAFLSEERREQTRILYGYSYCTMNSMMGSRPGHPFFRLAIDNMLSMPRLRHARLTTEPDFLTKLYKNWLSCTKPGDPCQTNEPVMLYPARLVSPLMDTSLVNWESKCQPYFSKAKRPKLEDKHRWIAMGCSQLVANGWNYDQTDNETVAIHRFLHLGYGSQGHHKTFSLFKEFPRIRTYYPR